MPRIHYSGPPETRHYARLRPSVFGWDADGGVVAPTVGLAFITPLEIPNIETYDAIGWIMIGSAGNIRAVIYADNGDTPQGGAILAELGSMAAPASPGFNAKVEVAWAAGQYLPQLVWLGIQFSDALCTYVRAGNIGNERWGAVGVLHDWKYDLGAFGAFTDPCPAVVQLFDGPVTYLRVASTP